MENDTTWAWRLYDEGRAYNSRLVPNQYDVVETNTEFLAGNQWLHLPDTPAMRKLPKPTINILYRAMSLFIASLTSTGTALQLTPLAYYDGSGTADPYLDATTVANAELENLLAKFNVEKFIHQALEDGARSGDYCAHFWFDPDALPYGGGMVRYGPYRGEIKMELVDGINVMFGNPNDREVEHQPYILICGRDTVENLEQERKRWRRNVKLYESGTAGKDEPIMPDSEHQEFPGLGGKIELDPNEVTGKALYVLLYTKKTIERDMTDELGNPVFEDVYDKDGNPVFEQENGAPVLDDTGAPIPKRKPAKEITTTVCVTKATRTAIIYEDVDTGLSRYPIAWGNWKEQKNQYHGRALVTELIPNQISLNIMFANAIRHLQMMAFPKVVYNADLLPAWTNEIGQAIGVRGLQPNQSVSSAAYVMPSAEMSAQVFGVIDKLMDYTKESLGLTDVQMGSAKAENTSALMILQTNAETPLENIKLRLQTWMKDIGAILLDMMGTYYGVRPVIVPRDMEELVIGPDNVPRIDPVTGTLMTQTVTRKVMEAFDFTIFKRLWFNVRVDAGNDGHFSRLNAMNMLQQLRADGTLDVIQYLERLPDNFIPRKQQLIAEIRASIAKGQQANAAAGAAIPTAGSPVSANNNITRDQLLQSMPGSMADQFDKYPTKAQNAAFRAQAMKT